MNLESWVAFVLASAALLVVPGPTILLVIGQSLGVGRRNALPLVLGVAAGDFTAMTLSLAGLGAVLASSALVFTLLKWAGAAYLIWLGIGLWRAPVTAAAVAPLAPWQAMRQAYVVTALNPKSIAFFVAFVPQFLVAEAAFLPQAALLVGSFVVLAALNAAGYALLAGRLAGAVNRPGVRRGFNRLGGGALVGAGLFTATARQG